MRSKTLLIADNDNRIRDLLALYFERKNFNVLKSANAAQAKSFINTTHIDLLLLDIMMPGQEDGLQLLKSLRDANNNIPTIFLTAKDELHNKIEGLEAGADDYVVKPFEPDELLARVKTLLRRSETINTVNNQSEVLFLGHQQFCLKTSRLINQEGVEINLSSTESLLLKTLASKPYFAFTRGDLAEKLGFSISERSIDVQINRLRKKLNDNLKKPIFVRTIRHVGYALYPKTLNEKHPIKKVS